VFEVRSAVSGRVRVVDVRQERRLIVAGDTLSVYPLDGDWSTVRHDYWWQALTAVALPARPSALLVGLGGGTQVHLLRAVARPRAITVIERDPVMVTVAERWFGLRAVPGIAYLCDDAERVVPALVRARRRFDFIMEDAAYADAADRALAMARSLVPLVSRQGILVVNRHRRSDAAGLAAVLRASFAEVRQRRVRREAENVLVICRRPRTRCQSAATTNGAPAPRPG
jgi:spermidine synthase